MTVEISIKLKRKQPALLLLSPKLYCFIKITHYMKSTNSDHFPFALKRAKPKNPRTNLLHHPKIKYFGFHTVFSSLIRQGKSSIIGNSSNLQDSEQGISLCVCVCACARICVHIFYSIVNMVVTKKKNQVCSIILPHFSNLFN